MKQEIIKAQKVSLTTQDNNVLKANFFDAKKKKCVLLIHQFSKNKEAWQILIESLLCSHSVLSIDLRGHGESTGNYKEFKEEDFTNMTQDVKAGINFLTKKGFDKKNISLIGASIGANLVRNYATSNPYDKVISLSPGLNYKGIQLILKNIKSLILVSKEDQYSYETTQELEKKSPDTECIYLTNKGHGMSLLEEQLISSIHLYLTEY